MTNVDRWQVPDRSGMDFAGGPERQARLRTWTPQLTYDREPRGCMFPALTRYEAGRLRVTTPQGHSSVSPSAFVCTHRVFFAASIAVFRMNPLEDRTRHRA